MQSHQLFEWKYYYWSSYYFIARRKKRKEQKKKQVQATVATNPNEEKLVGNGKETPKSDKT